MFGKPLVRVNCSTHLFWVASPALAVVPELGGRTNGHREGLLEVVGLHGAVALYRIKVETVNVLNILHQIRYVSAATKMQ